MKKALILCAALLVMMGLWGYIYWNETRKEISGLVIDFFLAAQEESLRAAEYLAADIDGVEELLQALALPYLDVPRTGRFEPVFHSLRRATVSIPISFAAGDAVMVDLVIVKGPEGWKITSFPDFLVLEQAAVKVAGPGSVTFIDKYGQEYTLQVFRQTNIGPEDAGRVGTVVGIAGLLADIRLYETFSINKLLAVSDLIIEGELAGTFQLESGAPFFQFAADSVRAVTVGQVIVGMEQVMLHLRDDLVRAVTLPQDYTVQNIRVLLNTTGFGGISHNKITVTSGSRILLEDKAAQKTATFSAEEKLTFTAAGEKIIVSVPAGDKAEYENRLFLSAENGRIYIETITRGNPPFTPGYYGHLEIRASNDQLYIVNEVPLEKYLTSVVPSEMPVSFGLTPLSLQAIAARTYAVASIYRSSWRRFAAHVDDSVSSQVYNNVPAHPISNEAVGNTTGMVVVYDGEIADTRYFSTSSGVTANFEEVWHDRESGAFPGTPLPYLRSGSQLRTGELPDLTTEAGARSFFRYGGWDSYDQESPWFRWQVEMTGRELENVLSRYLPERHRAQPEFVLTRENNSFVSRDIPAQPLGRLRDIRIIRRGRGGNIMELEIEGDNGAYRLIKEYTIRFTMRPVNIGNSPDVILRRHDGSALANYSILPSTFMVMDIVRNEDNTVQKVRIYGGGNGHGAGMSQWGARGLAEDGRSIAEILRHYYHGSSIANVYEDF